MEANTALVRGVGWSKNHRNLQSLVPTVLPALIHMIFPLLSTSLVENPLPDAERLGEKMSSHRKALLQ